jgi:hypothetical protein
MTSCLYNEQKQAGLKSKEQTKQIGTASMRTFKIQTKNMLLFKDLHPSYPMFTCQVLRLRAQSCIQNSNGGAILL